MEEKTEKMKESAFEQTSTSIEVFQDATQKWQEVNKNNNWRIDNVILANLFHIPMQDLIDVVDEIKGNAIAARAYVGIEEYDPTNNVYQMKLYFTGVDAAGNPILTNREGKSKIYDFTLPCPPTC